MKTKNAKRKMGTTEIIHLLKIFMTLLQKRRNINISNVQDRDPDLMTIIIELKVKKENHPKEVHLDLQVCLRLEKGSMAIIISKLLF